MIKPCIAVASMVFSVVFSTTYSHIYVILLCITWCTVVPGIIVMYISLHLEIQFLLVLTFSFKFTVGLIFSWIYTRCEDPDAKKGFTTEL